MILFELIALALLSSLLAGGSVSNLSRESLRGETVLLILLPAQLFWPTLSTRLGIPCALSVIAWLVMMSCLSAVLMLNTPRRPVLAVAALGIAANILVIGVNQAMPVSIGAASEIGESRDSVRQALQYDCMHEELDERTLLPLLADVIAIPGPSWHRGVVSIGDLLLAFGLGGWVFVAARSSGRGSVS